MRNAEYPPSPFSSFRHPKGCLFMFGARADNRTAFCTAKTWFAVAAIFATQKSTVESRMSDFFRNRISGRNSARRSVPTRELIVLISSIFSMVCLCLGRERIIEPLFAQQKLSSPKQPQRRAAAADCEVGSTRNFPSNARGVRKIRERTVPTLAVYIFPTSERMSVYVWGESG